RTHPARGRVATRSVACHAAARRPPAALARAASVSRREGGAGGPPSRGGAGRSLFGAVEPRAPRRGILGQARAFARCAGAVDSAREAAQSFVRTFGQRLRRSLSRTLAQDASGGAARARVRLE